MSKEIYYESGIVDTRYDESTKSIMVTWMNLGPHDYLRPCLEAQVDCVKNDGAKIIIVDTVTAKGTLSMVDQNWLATDVFPVYEAYGVKAVITAVPKRFATQLAANQWEKTGSQFGVDFVNAASVEAAEKLAEEYLAGIR